MNSLRGVFFKKLISKKYMFILLTIYFSLCFQKNRIFSFPSKKTEKNDTSLLFLPLIFILSRQKREKSFDFFYYFCSNLRPNKS